MSPPQPTARNPDAPDEATIARLIRIYEASGKRLEEIVLHPSGNLSAPYNQARAALLLGQVQQELRRLKGGIADWTGTALTEAQNRGYAAGSGQVTAAGIKPLAAFEGTFERFNRGAVERLARETATDLNTAAEGMAGNASATLRKLAGLEVTPAQVNDILAGRYFVQGSPREAIQDLRGLLLKVHGEKVEIPCKDGVTRSYDSKYYAEMIARTKTRQVSVQTRHERLRAAGLDLVRVFGRISPNFCTDFVGHIYSLSGTSDKYPPIEDLPVSGVMPPGPPFHPNCSKSTAPYIEGLSNDELPAYLRRVA